MFLTTLYENGIRYLSVILYEETIPELDAITTIWSPNLKVTYEVLYGDTYIAITQRITDKDLELYKKDFKSLTARRIY